jgi:hypothetical protein
LRDPDDILRELACIVFADVRDLFDKHGNLRAIDGLPDDAVAAIVSIRVVQRRLVAGDKGMVVVGRVEMANELKALELLAKLSGLFQECSRVRDDAALLARLDEGRKRVATETRTG